MGSVSGFAMADLGQVTACFGLSFSSVIMGIIMSTHRAVEKFNWVNT